MRSVNWSHLHPKYAGKWVAFAEDEKTVVSSSVSLAVVMKEANKKGYKLPLTFKVPAKMAAYVGAL